MKVSGNFACGKCPVIVYDEFDIDETKINDKNYLFNSIFVKCPSCGKKISDDIPNILLVVAKALVNRGYSIKMCFENTLGIAFSPQLTEEDIKKYNITPPNEFNIDLTENGITIVSNDRMQANDYEGLDKEEYINTSLINLLSFAKSLPTIGNGKYINISNKEG